jgi:hypothetical protein
MLTWRVCARCSYKLKGKGTTKTPLSFDLFESDPTEEVVAVEFGNLREDV